MAAGGSGLPGAGSGEEELRLGEDEYGTYRIDDRVWTMNEIRDHPLFMEDVPSDISENPHLLALQSLLYDGQTQEQMAEHFRKLGNEAFRTSTNRIASQNALMAYTRGLEMECSDNALNSQLHSNRAAVSLRLGEYDKTVNDCRRAVQLDPTNAKAHYRAAQASENLGLTAQALSFVSGGMKSAPEAPELLKMRQRLTRKLEQEEEERSRSRRLDEQAALERSSADASVRALLEERGVRLGPLLFDVAMYSRGSPPKPRLSDDGAAVQWPLLILYDETSQSDFVDTFDERCTLEEQMQLMFPGDRHVEWDEDGKYVWDRLVAYLEYYPEEGRETQMLRLAADTALQEVLCNRCVPPCLGLHVLVAGSAALEAFCRTHSLPHA
mmetsp:Transcript_34678/g.110188  ORF Transcript_34678/g.110188 Transcript_34678/m.110188 type:complete len:382 (-) Transcript_34678:73-1218(-)